MTSYNFSWSLNVLQPWCACLTTLSEEMSVSNLKHNTLHNCHAPAEKGPLSVPSSKASEVFFSLNSVHV